MADSRKSGRGQPIQAASPPPFSKWKNIFLSELAATSNVGTAAQRAGIAAAAAFDARRKRSEFRRQWHAALCEGYDHLEMELLYRLRKGEVKPAKDANRGLRSFDNATAFRQLAAHREANTQGKAIRENEDADAILASIDAKLDKMRERAAARASRIADDEK